MDRTPRSAGLSDADPVTSRAQRFNVLFVRTFAQAAGGGMHQHHVALLHRVQAMRAVLGGHAAVMPLSIGAAASVSRTPAGKRTTCSACIVRTDA